jgi:hypothetical protein
VATYEGSYSGLGQFMNGPEMQEAMRQIAEEGAEYARSIAPVDSRSKDDPHRGEYKDSFEVTVQGYGGPRKNRAEARITNTAPYATLVEWRDNHHTLGQTAAQMGTE